MNGDMVLDWHNNKKWNPRKYDGDAFRLAIQLKMEISYSQDGTIEVLKRINYLVVGFCKFCDGMPALRRLILKVAASAGAQMP